MATGDPAIDAAFSDAPTTSTAITATGDPVIDAAFRTTPTAAQPPGFMTRLGRVASMAIDNPGKAALGAAENILGGVTGGVGSLADAVTLSDPGTHNWAYQPKTAAGKEIQGLEEAETGAVGKGYDKAFGTGPLARTLKERLPEFAGAAGTVAGIGGAAESALTKAPVVAAETPHPLAAASQAENARIQQMHIRGTAAGLDLPVGASPGRAATAAANNQPIGNALVRQELKLPNGAPLTPQLLTQARQLYASPGYEAVKAIPDPIPLDSTQQATLNDVRPMVGGRIALPEGDTITGQQAVDLSKKLRARAAQLDKAQGITATGDIPSDLADAHRDAAEAIEDATKSHLERTGRGDLAQNWDNARVYTAKTYSAQDALDGAGNVNVSKLKQQVLKGKPLSGNLEMLASLAARFPNAMKLTPESAPAPGFMQRAGAAVAPSAGALAGEAIGSGLGAPGLGSVIGARLGKSAAEKIVPP